MRSLHKIGQGVRCVLSKKGKIAVCVVLAVAIISGIFLWKACMAKRAVKQTQEIFAGAFEAEVTIKGGDATLTAVLGRDENGAVTLTVKEPSPLAGIVLKQKDGRMTASYGNMEVPLTLQGLPAGSAITPLFSMLSGAAEMIGANVKEEDEKLILSGNCDAGPYTVILNQKDGTVLQVNFPDAGFTCDFDRFLKKSN